MARKGEKLGVNALIASSVAYRTKLFAKILEHIRSGFSLDCVKEIGPETLLVCLKEYPQEFDKDAFDAALREGKKGWEDIGKKQATGHCIGNSRAWVYNMINRYGWSDRLKVDADIKSQVSVQVVSYADSTPSNEPSTKSPLP